MPNAKTHDNITFIFSGPVFLLSFLITGSYLISILVFVSFLFSGWCFNGDLDLNSKPYKRWSILRFIWKPYQKVFPHRSFFTHGPIIGTLIRVIWLLILCLPLLYFYFHPVWNFSLIHYKEMLAILTGLEGGAFSHYAADAIVSFWRKRI